MFGLFLLAAFLMGAFPTAYWAGRRFRGMDIRQYGSGNAGATNAFRVFGPKIGSAVFAIDFLKGFLPVLCFKWILGNGPHLEEWSFLIGAGAILGHVFTPFLNFKGGKGIATGGGVLCAALPAFFLVGLAVWGAAFAWTRIVSVSSLASSAGLVLLSILTGSRKSILWIFIALFLLVLWTHRSNIKRIGEGKER